MRIKCLHIVGKTKNPFMGESMIAFLQAKPDDENEIAQFISAEQLQQAKSTDPEIQKINAITISRVDGVFEGPDVQALSDNFENLLKELNGLQNSIDHIRDYQKKLQRGDLTGITFISKANQILEQLRVLQGYAQAGSLGTDIAFSTDPNRLNSVDSNQVINAPTDQDRLRVTENIRTELNATLAAIIEDFKNQQAPIKEKMKLILLDELEAKIKGEKRLWEEDPAIKDVVTKESYDEALKAMAGFETGLAEFRTNPTATSIDQLIDLKGQIDAHFTGRREEISKTLKEEINEKTLEDRLNKLEEKLKPGGSIQKYFDPIKKSAHETLAKIQQTRALIESNKERFKEDELKTNIEALNESIKRLKEYESIDTDAMNLINDNTVYPDIKAIGKVPKGLRNQLAHAQKIQNPLQKKLFINSINEPLTHAERNLNEEKFDTLYREEIPKFESGLQKFEHELGLQAGEPKGKKIYWMSIYSFQRQWEILKEWAPHRFNRWIDEGAYKVGEAVAGKLNIPLLQTETLKGEFANKVHDSEHHEVSRIAGLLKPHDQFHNRHSMYNVNHRDELRAYIDVLTEIGAMRWDDPKFLTLLNKFQTAIVFDVHNPDREMEDPSKFYMRLQDACRAIWDDLDIFRGWRQKNSQAYESGKSKFENDANQLAETGRGLRGWLSDALLKVRSNPHDNGVDPIEYEAYIQYAIDKGKMAPEDRLYFLVQGIDAGILHRYRGSELDSKTLNGYPPIEMFSAGENITYEDIKVLAAIDKARCKPGPAYIHHFQLQIMHRKGVKERLEKTISQGNGLDHDDMVRYAGYLEDQTMINLLSQKTSGFQLPSTGVLNSTTGFLNYIDMLALGYDEIPDKERELSRFVSTFLNFDTITRGRKYAGKGNSYFRWGTSGMDEQVPRGAGSIYRSEKSAKVSANQLVKKTKSFIQYLDQDGYIEFLNKTPIPSPEEVKKFVTQLKNKPQYQNKQIFGENPDPQDYDSLVDVSGSFFNFIVTTYPSRVQNMISKIKADIAADSAEEKKGLKEGKKTTHEKFQNAWKKSVQWRANAETKIQNKKTDIKLESMGIKPHASDHGHGDGHEHGPQPTGELIKIPEEIVDDTENPFPEPHAGGHGH